MMCTTGHLKMDLLNPIMSRLSVVLTREQEMLVLKYEKQTKKTRQIYTFSHPSKIRRSLGKTLDDAVDVYECTGDMSEEGFDYSGGLQQSSQHFEEFFNVENERLELMPLPPLSATAEHLPGKLLLSTGADQFEGQGDLQDLEPCNNLKFNPNAYPKLMESCFPCGSKYPPELFYTISNQSFPAINEISVRSPKNSSTQNYNGLSVAQLQQGSILISVESARDYYVNPQQGKISTAQNEVCQEFPKAERAKSCKANNISLSPNGTFIIESRKLMSLLDSKDNCPKGIPVLPTHGKFLSFAKFNSSFKIFENVYEDITNQMSEISHFQDTTKSANISFESPIISENHFECFHKLNPEFDDNQSITEAYTTAETPSVISADMRSDLLGKVRQHLVKPIRLNDVQYGSTDRAVNYSTSDCLYDEKVEDWQPRCEQHDKHPTFTQFKSGTPKLSLSALNMSLNYNNNIMQMETNLWSSTSSDQTNLPPSTPTMKNNSSVSSISASTTRPFWRIKGTQFRDPWDQRRTKKINSFVLKAHYYMCGKNWQRRSLLPKTVFVDAASLNDESTQCPDEGLRSCRQYQYTSPRTTPFCKVLDKLQKTLQSPYSQKSNRQVQIPDRKRVNNNEHSYKEISRNSPPVISREQSHLTKQTLNNVNYRVKTPHRTMHNLPSEQFPTTQPFTHSFRAQCDQRRIRIKYENGRYTVYKEVGESRKRTVWSLLTGKANNLFSSVISKKLPEEKMDMTKLHYL